MALSIQKTLFNLWNETSSNVLKIVGGLFSNVTVYNVNINVKLGSVLLVVFLLSAVYFRPSMKSNGPDPTHVHPADGTDVCVYVPQPPNAGPRRHRELRSQFHNIQTYIEKTSPLRSAGLRFNFTDDHPNGSMPAKICVIYCDGIDYAAQSCLNMEKIQAEVVILIMSYGPKRTAKILIDGGIKVVRWFKVDTSTVNLKSVVKDYIVPLLEELRKQERTVEGSSFGVLSEFTGNGHFLDKDENNEHGTEIHRSRTLKGEATQLINFKKKTPTEVSINLMKDWSIWGFDQHKLNTLRYHSSDPEALEDFKGIVRSQRDFGDGLVIAVENNHQPCRNDFDRRRAIALYICMDLAEDSSSIYPGGIYRIAPEPDRCTKEVFCTENEDILASGLRMLIWIDGASKIFSSAQQFEEWRKKNINAPATFVITSTDDEDFATSQGFLNELRQLRTVKALKAPLVMGGPPNIVSSSHFEAYEGAIRFLPSNDCSDQRPSDDLVARVLKAKTAAFSNSLSKHIGIFKDDNGSWIVVVRISVASQLKRIFTSIYNQGVENMVNEALTAECNKAWIDAKRVERAERVGKVRLLRVSVVFATMLFILKQVIKTIFFEETYMTYNCVALATTCTLIMIVEKYLRESPGAVNAKDPLPDAAPVPCNTTTPIFTINLQDAIAMYELGVLCIDTMTPEQIEIIDQASDLSKFHVMGVAGSGKTFIGMYFVLKFLKEQEDKKESVKKKKILFVCPTLALSFYFANWLLSRMQLNDAEEENELLECVVFLVGVSDEHVYRMTVLEDDSLDVKTKERAEDFDFSAMDIGMVIIDEAHEKFAKKETRFFKLWNEGGEESARHSTHEERFHSIFNFEGVEASKALHGILTRRDENGKQCKTILLSDISQATTTVDRVVFPKNYKMFHLDEVTRCSKTVMLASKAFLLDNGRKTTCAHDTDGNMVTSNLFDIPEGSDEAELYKDKVREEIERVRDLYKGMDLHMRLAIITPDEKRLKKHDYFTKLLAEIGLERISAVDAMKCRTRRKRNKLCSGPLNDKNKKKQKVMVDTISEVKGLEFLFVILADMDRPVSEYLPEANKKRQSWFYSGISRSHCHVSIVNKNVRDGFLSWLHSTQAATVEKGSYVSIAEEHEIINPKAITWLVMPPIQSSSRRSKISFTRNSTCTPTSTIKSSVWNNVDNSSNTEYRLENTRFNPLEAPGAAPNLQNDHDLVELCKQNEWEKVKNYLRFSSDSDVVKKRRLMWNMWKRGEWNCLQYAIARRFPSDLVMAMIEIGGKDVVTATNGDGYTLLHFACECHASFDLINTLIDVGGRESVKVIDNGTSLSIRIATSDEEGYWHTVPKNFIGLPSTDN